jgi:hypothetical protein
MKACLLVLITLFTIEIVADIRAGRFQLVLRSLLCVGLIGLVWFSV